MDGSRHALGAATVISGVFLTAEVVRKRRLDFFAGVILTGFVVGFAITFISGDARFMLVKDSVVTGLIGSAFLVSALIGKPLVYLAARSGMTGADPDRTAAFEERYRTRPAMRRAFVVLSGIWGAGLLIDAGLRVVLIYQLPVATMVWLSTLMMIVTFALLIGLSFALGRRWRAAGERADAAALAAATV